MHKLCLDDIMTISRTCLSVFSNNDLDFTRETKPQIQFQASVPNKDTYGQSSIAKFHSLWKLLLDARPHWAAFRETPIYEQDIFFQ